MIEFRLFVNICDGSYGNIELLYIIVSTMIVNSALNMFYSRGSLFDIFRSLWALYIPYDAVFACHILGEISMGGIK